MMIKWPINIRNVCIVKLSKSAQVAIGANEFEQVTSYFFKGANNGALVFRGHIVVRGVDKDVEDVGHSELVRRVFVSVGQRSYGSIVS